MLGQDEETRLQAAQAPVIQPEAAQPETAQPTPRIEAAQPEVARPETTQPEAAARAEAERRRKNIDRGVWGAMLVVLGLMALAANIWNSALIGTLVLPVLGVMFIVWGYLQRSGGLMIPGGILTGLGLGTLAQQTLLVTANGEARGGIVVLGLALGFLAIMPLSQMAEGHFHWWPSIPGGILLVVALAILAGPGGVGVLQALGMLWPVALIAVGAYLLWMLYRSRGGEGERDRDRRGLPS
ncbi:MAG TPA: hypothetical protein VFQ25_11790 [Ktedonobacterales bacterium]|nr:hypothetical protein [Ktedonobacterales bacterium]